MTNFFIESQPGEVPKSGVTVLIADKNLSSPWGEKLLMHDCRVASGGHKTGLKTYGTARSGGARELRRSKFSEILTNSVKIFKIRVKFFAPNDFLLT